MSTTEDSATGDDRPAVLMDEPANPRSGRRQLLLVALILTAPTLFVLITMVTIGAPKDPFARSAFDDGVDGSFFVVGDDLVALKGDDRTIWKDAAKGVSDFRPDVHADGWWAVKPSADTESITMRLYVAGQDKPERVLERPNSGRLEVVQDVVFVSGPGDGTIVRHELLTDLGDQDLEITEDQRWFDIGILDGAVWVLDQDEPFMARTEAFSNNITRTASFTALVDPVWDLGFNSAWVVESGGNLITRLDINTNKRLDIDMETATPVTLVLSTERYVWVIFDDGTSLVVDPESNDVAARFNASPLEGVSIGDPFDREVLRRQFDWDGAWGLSPKGDLVRFDVGSAGAQDSEAAAPKVVVPGPFEQLIADEGAVWAYGGDKLAGVKGDTSYSAAAPADAVMTADDRALWFSSPKGVFRLEVKNPDDGVKPVRIIGADTDQRLGATQLVGYAPTIPVD
ncbi:MAG: hypothetical protein KAZ88_00440 [Acidimicrobiia bacterium]|nr:hypothetical protein [Acidimicrobiia bacterium]MBP8179444.1 hypothetical protein [Acidimicrobiia bacterium]